MFELTCDVTGDSEVTFLFDVIDLMRRAIYVVPVIFFPRAHWFPKYRVSGKK